MKRILPGSPKPPKREADVQLMPILKKPQQIKDFLKVKK